MKTLILLLLISTNSFASLFPQQSDPLCFEYAKSLIKSSYNEGQLEELKDSCRFNNNNLCIYELTKNISYTMYNEINEIIMLAKSCQYVRPRCVGVIKKYLEVDQYSSFEGISKLTQICQDTSFKCLESECSKDSSKCNTLDKIELFRNDCLR